MERLTRKCVDTKNGEYIPYVVDNYRGIYPDSTLGKVVERLAYYEDLEEQGRLIVKDGFVDLDFPCSTCETISKSCADDCLVLKDHIKSINGY